MKRVLIVFFVGIIAGFAADYAESGLTVGTTSGAAITFLDEDDLSSNSATACASQQSVKAYADANGGANVYVLSFGGDMNSVGAGPNACGRPYEADIAMDTPQRAHAIPITGTITKIAWSSASADATTDIKPWISGSAGSKIDLTGATGVVTGLSVAVTAGQYLEIEFDAGTAPDEAIINVYITED